MTPTKIRPVTDPSKQPKVAPSRGTKNVIPTPCTFCRTVRQIVKRGLDKVRGR